ncbi:MAG: LysR family transcriptional regulator, partial [Bdellovibrionia bacterium]
MWTEELKLKEINLFLDLVKTSSVRELARQRNLQPGQVSKGIRALEQKLGVTLVERSAQGVRLTPIGTDLVPYLENMQKLQESLAGALSTEKEAPTLTFASTSYFSTNFLPSVFGDMKNEKFKVQMFRFVDVLPYLNSSQEVARHLKE